jgi:nucleotidyltransferase/DNA polymerase involved in DNA repair
VIVGGDPRKRGRVQAATPDALRAGVELESPMLEALRVCPQAKAVRTNMAHYREVSRKLMIALRRCLPSLEVFGMAAVYADLPSGDDATARAEALRRTVRDGLDLPLRVGVASGKFLARLAAEEIPEEGLHCIPVGGEEAFLSPMPVTRLDGVGRKTAATLAELGAHTIGDVRRLGRARLQDLFGAHGLRIHAYANGSDDEPVRASRPRSVSREATVRGEALDVPVLVEQLSGLAQILEQELMRQGLAAGKVTLKLRFADQGTTTRTQTLADPVTAAPVLLDVAQGLLARTPAGARPVRGVGLQLAGLVGATESDRQLSLFQD